MENVVFLATRMRILSYLSYTTILKDLEKLRELSKIVENCRKMSKIVENCRKLPNFCNGLRKHIYTRPRKLSTYSQITDMEKNWKSGLRPPAAPCAPGPTRLKPGSHRPGDHFSKKNRPTIGSTSTFDDISSCLSILVVSPRSPVMRNERKFS